MDHSRDPVVRFDQFGFLVEPSIWSEDLAEAMAREDGIGELRPEHWEVIMYLREEYLDNGGPPAVGDSCRITHQDPHCIERLFHSMREAWRIAGLPDPGEEARTYM